HDDGLFRAGVDAVAAEDAAQHVDLVDHRVLLDVDVGMLAGLDVDALGRAGLRAEVAGDAAHRAVRAGGQDVMAAEAVTVVAALLRVLDGVPAAGTEEVAQEVPDGHGQASEEGKVELLGKASAIRPNSGRIGQRPFFAHRSSSPATTLRPPSEITASETEPPR